MWFPTQRWRLHFSEWQAVAVHKAWKALLSGRVNDLTIIHLHNITFNSFGRYQLRRDTMVPQLLVQQITNTFHHELACAIPFGCLHTPEPVLRTEQVKNIDFSLDRMLVVLQIANLA